MEKRIYLQPLITVCRMEASALLAGSGEYIKREEPEDPDPDRELWEKDGESRDYWIAE